MFKLKKLLDKYKTLKKREENYKKEYNVFKARALSASLAKLITYYEGEEYISNVVKYSYFEDCFDGYGRDTRLCYTSCLVIMKKSDQDKSLNQLGKLEKEGNLITIATNSDYFCYESSFEPIRLFKTNDNYNINLNNFSYVCEFLDWLIDYRKKMGLLVISDCTLDELTDIYIEELKKDNNLTL